jgi:hypothetical protein
MSELQLSAGDLQLYWVTTEDHAEDWFMVASNPGDAARCFEQNIGYEAGSATAEKLLDIPTEVDIRPADPEWFEGWADWPANESLVAIGEWYIDHDPDRIHDLASKQVDAMDTFISIIDPDPLDELSIDELEAEGQTYH